VSAFVIDPLLLKQLRSLVGRHIEYAGKACCVIEILDSEKALVIQCEGKQRVIQGNQFGEATRRVQQCHTLPLFDDSGKLHPVIADWID
jgi:hypothetical protein